MGTAQIRIDQPAHPTTPIGVPGRSRDDIVLGATVQLRNADDTGVRSHRWQILDQPDLGAPDLLSNPQTAAPTFTPNAEGTYRLRLSVDEGRTGQVDTRTVVVRTARGTRIPAAGERDESNWIDPDTGLPNARGWKPDMLLSLSRAVSATVNLAENATHAVAVTDGTVTLHSSDASAKPATMTATYPGHRVTALMRERSSTGSYTYAATQGTTSGTVTLDAVNEGVVLEYDGTIWRVIDLLGGAGFA